jgi:hypothetical protein
METNLIKGSLVGELLEMYQNKNGFYAFESALHVYPAQSCLPEIGLDNWNASDNWKKFYNGMADELMFFAEDIFANQFCIKNNNIYCFNSETAELELLANNMEEWANSILEDYDVLTGHKIAHKWQQMYGRIEAGMRLMPKKPFVVGGDFAIENLYLLEAFKIMQSNGNIAVQIKDLPDGAQLKFKVID